MRLSINDSLKAILTDDTETEAPQVGIGFSTDYICSYILRILMPCTNEQWIAYKVLLREIPRVFEGKGFRLSMGGFKWSDPYINFYFHKDLPLNFSGYDFLKLFDPAKPEIVITEIAA